MYENLVKRMKAVGYNSYMIDSAIDLVNELQQSGVQGVDKFVNKLKDRAYSEKDYLDILREGRFGVILAKNGFKEIHIEYCRTGPDLKASFNRNTIYFEVTRKRPGEQDEQWAQSEAAWASPHRIENIISIIQDEVKQLESGKVNIVVIWSDTVRLRWVDVEAAIQEINQNPGVYTNLSGILVTEAGEAQYPPNFRLFKNGSASRPLGIRLARKLESLHGDPPKQLKREFELLAVALKLDGKKNS